MVKPKLPQTFTLVEALTGNLVSESLRLDDRDVVDDTLVGVEISSESILTGRLVS